LPLLPEPVPVTEPKVPTNDPRPDVTSCTVEVIGSELGGGGAPPLPPATGRADVNEAVRRAKRTVWKRMVTGFDGSRL
jgi:hypothetical protein